MKLKSLIMFSAAALAFAACSNDENNGVTMPEGNATVVLKLDNPATRAAASPVAPDAQNGAQVPVEYNRIRVVLTAAAGGVDKTLSAEELQKITSEEGMLIENVRTPQSLKVYINAASTDDTEYQAIEGKTLDLSKYYNCGLAEPLFGESKDFKDVTEEVGGDVQTYKVVVTPVHRMARVEFSGITHDDGDEQCLYQTLDIDGLFLNGIKLTENGTETTYTTWATANVAANVTKEAFAANTSFLGGATFPATGQCYGWNIFPGLPKLTFCFSNATPKDTGATITNPRYATVTGYETEAGDAITSFEAGNIYRIKEIKVADKYIGDKITGAEDVNVIAVVEVLNWTVVDAKVTWE